MASRLTSKNSCLVFVGGVPAKTSKELVQRYFLQFTPFVSVHFFNSSRYSENQSAAALKNRFSPKGYCILELSDQESADRILAHRPHIFNGRILFCTPSKTGTALARHNRQTCLRRMILKQVPGYFSDSEIVSLLEDQIGKVESLYRYESLKKKGRPKQFVSFSVTFQSATSCSSMDGLTVPIWFGDGEFFIAEKYSFKREVESDPTRHLSSKEGTLSSSKETITSLPDKNKDTTLISSTSARKNKEQKNVFAEQSMLHIKNTNPASSYIPSFESVHSPAKHGMHEFGVWGLRFKI